MKQEEASGERNQTIRQMGETRVQTGRGAPATPMTQRSPTSLILIFVVCGQVAVDVACQKGGAVWRRNTWAL